MDIKFQNMKKLFTLVTGAGCTGLSQQFCYLDTFYTVLCPVAPNCGLINYFVHLKEIIR